MELSAVAERFLESRLYRCALVVPPLFWGTMQGSRASKSLNSASKWWAHKGSNLGPLPCEGNALPLSYAPGTVALVGEGLG